jgi:hypothetical protein
MSRLLARSYLLALAAFAFLATPTVGQLPARHIFPKEEGTSQLPARYIFPKEGAVVDPVKPVTPQPVGGLSQYINQRVTTRLNALPQQQQQRYQDLTKRAASAEERIYLAKAFAAGNDFTALESFANTIRGKDKNWLRDNCHLCNSTTMTGLKQQFSHSCGPAMVHVLVGEVDPIYAYRLRQANPNYAKADDRNGLAMNPDQAKKEKDWLESPYAGTGAQGGAAVARVGAAGGRGRWCEDIINQFTDKTGLTYRAKHLGGTYTHEVAMREMEQALDKGYPVPFVAKRSDGSHYLLALSYRVVNGQKVYVIHDTWVGQTVTRTEADFNSKKLNLSGNHELSTVSFPTPR